MIANALNSSQASSNPSQDPNNQFKADKLKSATQLYGLNFVKIYSNRQTPTKATVEANKVNQIAVKNSPQKLIVPKGIRDSSHLGIFNNVKKITRPVIMIQGNDLPFKSYFSNKSIIYRFPFELCQ
eukprot:TRINITY_DN10995_c0_g1_i1.p4 TRINITY_DN10995_c0_g1~~TRINITY_DN10995_c0_g1_i1.p4  ORF type:complete len:126 (-),score=34.75 TRINITY_DN10995_c0_g1_i1:1163-1540(-)